MKWKIIQRVSFRDDKSTHTLISVLFGVIKFCSLRGEGRRGSEGRDKNRVSMKHINIRLN